jgi:phosphoglucomutase
MDYQVEYQKWLNNKELPTELKTELEGIKADVAAITDRFYGHLDFGTAGIRGILGAGINRMNIYTVARAAYGVARYIESLGGDAKARGAVISYDTRNYSFDFALRTAGVLAARGVRARLFDNVRPVPMLSFAVRETGAAAGVMITASHNPKEYNGFKVYGADGAQMSLDGTAAVVKFIEEAEDIFSIPYAPTSNLIEIVGEKIDRKYFDKITGISLFDIKGAATPVKVVYTALHGSGLMPVTTLFKMRGIDYAEVPEQSVFDGNFPTVTLPNPENADALKMGIALAEKTGAAVVIGTDPDCDRMGAAVRGGDGKFVLLTGNQTGALLLDYIIERRKTAGTLPKNAVFIKTIVTSSLGAAVAAASGVGTDEVLTGFKFIGEKIREYEQSGDKTFLFGYEESYGFLAHTFSRDKDAAAASMLLAEMSAYYAGTGGIYARLQHLFKTYGYYLERNVSREYVGADGMKSMSAAIKNIAANVKDAAGGLKVLAVRDYGRRVRTENGKETALTLPRADALYYELEHDSWVCVRPSGTEPKLKLYIAVKGKDKANAETVMEGLVEYFKGLL